MFYLEFFLINKHTYVYVYQKYKLCMHLFSESHLLQVLLYTLFRFRKLTDERVSTRMERVIRNKFKKSSKLKNNF